MDHIVNLVLNDVEFTVLDKPSQTDITKEIAVAAYKSTFAQRNSLTLSDIKSKIKNDLIL